MEEEIAANNVRLWPVIKTYVSIRVLPPTIMQKRNLIATSVAVVESNKRRGDLCFQTFWPPPLRPWCAVLVVRHIALDALKLFDNTISKIDFKVEITRLKTGL